MTNPILATKLCHPILRRDIVPRPRLIERLNAGLWQPEGFVRKLTLVSAPAGFGKTTLVSEWLSQKDDVGRITAQRVNMKGGQSQAASANRQPFQTAWLSLEDSDNDPSRFLAYLIAALRTLQAGFGEGIEALVQLSQPPPQEVILTALVNEISGMPAPFILALDDYHAIHTAAIHQQLAFLLDHQPATMHLVILTREDPLLPFARLRARGQLLEIRQGELRFTSEEIAMFLQRESGVAIGKDEIAALERHTEGWGAGLQMAALSMRGCEDITAFVRDFTGSERFILDYLVEEVFERQPPDVQAFLLRTSILKRLNGLLCDAVTGQRGGAEMLHGLEQANLFIVPIDPPHTWYRYHHLFADLLQQRLRLSDVPEAGLHQNASRWFEAQGFIPEAVDHSLQARDWGNAARLIGASGETMLKRGETVTLLNWFGRLPREVTQAAPRLCMLYIWAALINSQFELAAPLLDQLEQSAEPGSEFLGEIAGAQAMLARSKRDNARTIEKSEQALALLPEADLAMRGIIAMNLGLAYWHEGQLVETELVLRQASDLCSRSGNHFAWLTAQLFLAKTCAARGKIRQAAAMAEELIRAGGEVPILCLAYYDLAVIHHEWNDLTKAREHLDKAISFSQRTGNMEFLQAGHLQKAILAHAQGDEAGASLELGVADGIARDLPAVTLSRTAAFGVQLALWRNDPSMLSRWSAQVKGDVDAHSFYRFMGLTRPRLLIADGKKDEAAEALKATYETASRSGWGYGMIAVRILQSLAAGSSEAAMPFLMDALQMGEPEGFMRSFLEAGSAIVPLLEEAVRRGVHPDYASQILSAMGVRNRKMAAGQASLVEPLSEREMEVLKLVSAGLSNREIALKLVISPGTAKTHIHNLCGKLGARNRTEAAMRAKELGLA